MASSMVRKTLTTFNPNTFRILTFTRRYLNVAAAGTNHEQSSFTFSSDEPDLSNLGSNSDRNGNIYIKGPDKATSFISMPMSFMTGSIVYKKVTTREAEDEVGWSVMLDYRTLKTPAKRNLKCPTLALAKAIAAEWEYPVH